MFAILHNYLMHDRSIDVHTCIHTVCNLLAILSHFMNQSGVEEPFQCKDNGRSKRKQVVV